MPWLPSRRAKMELLTSEQVAAAPTPARILAREARDDAKADWGIEGIGQSYSSSLEKGARKDDPALFKRLASALRVWMEDLVER